MIASTNQVRTPITVLALVAAVVAASRCPAAITEISATLDAAVVEFVGGAEGSNDSSIETFPGTAVALPVEAFAGLGDFSGDLGLDYGARAVATFNDPTLANDPNPAEFGCEAVAFSLDASIAHQTTAQVHELRDVVFSVDDLDVNTSGASNLVFSTAFVDGAMLLWTTDAARDLTGMSADFVFQIIQDDATGETVVFEAEVAVNGEADGEVQLVHSSVLDVALGGPELLAGRVNAATLQALESIGRVHVVLVPTQAVEYAYFADAGTPFELRAEARCGTSDLASGTGSAAVFGAPFAGLASALEPFLDQSKATDVQRAMNEATRTSADGGDGSPLAGALCGSLGFEAPLLAMLGFCGFRRRLQRS